MKGLLFVYALTYGGAVISLFRPWYGLLIYVCFAILRPESLWFWAFQGGGGNFSRVIAIALLIGWGIHGFGHWNLGRSRTTVIAFIGFWVWALLSTVIVASDQEVGFHFVENQAKVLLPFLAGITLIKTERQVKQLAWVILLSQGYVAWDMNQSYLNGINPLMTPWGTGGFAGMDNNCVAIAMVAGAGLAFFLGMHVSQWWKKLPTFACAALMAHAVLFSFSRGGMIGLILTGVATFFLIDKHPRHFALFGLAAAAALMLAGPEVREEFWSSFADEEVRDYSSQSRIDMWKICLRIMADNPIFGVGPDHFPLMASSFGFAQGKEAHTLWLQIGAELGAVGLGFLLLFYLSTAIKLWPIACRKVSHATEWDVGVARMIIAAFAGFMVSAQFVSLEGLELPYYLTMIGAGTLKLCSQKRQALALHPQWQHPGQFPQHRQPAVPWAGSLHPRSE